MIVFSVRTNFQAAIGLPFWRIRIAIIATMEATLIVNATISNTHEVIVLRFGGSLDVTLGSWKGGRRGGDERGST